ncbi:MAG: peptidyl-alpha-hydroxyglycine alpha-amidating lyase family protein [Chloroflexi bacterium]|nr:peptidyl-alpha-hydroxyglycine alpha-amidating lyase family protein [Chloroflexota bacterium]
MVRVGASTRVYEQLESWEKLPEGWVLGQTAIVTDSQDRVYLFNRGDHPLIVLDREGNFLNSWGEGQLPDAHGMFIDGDDNLYMPVKNSHVVLKYKPDGNLLMTLGEWDKPSDTGWSGNYSDPAVRAAGPFNRPSDIALDAKGDLYISDGYGNSRVHKFSADGKLQFSWGEPGKTGPGEFHVPHGVWVHTDGRVFVADRENNRIQIFDADGKYLDEWGGLARPCDIYIDQDDVLYVPELDGFMTILSIDGDVIATWGSPLDAGWGNGAHAVWVDSHGDIYVNQNVEGHRLVKYLRQ